MQFPHSYYRNQALALHSRWVESLRSIKEVAEPSAKMLWIDDLCDLAKMARELEATGQLHPQDAALLAHITDRPIQEHIALVKGSAVVPAF
jgi:hypothetical protein